MPTMLWSGLSMRLSARRFLGAMRERLQEFSASLHPDKTRLIEFGRFAAATASGAGSANRRHSTSCASPSSAASPAGANSRSNGRPDVTALRAKLKEIKEELRRRMHQSIPEQGKWLRQVAKGYFNYHAVPTNIRALATGARGDSRPYRDP
jgi:hypothetical protein